MKIPFVFSTRLFFAMLFSGIVIGGALYSKHNTAQPHTKKSEQKQLYTTSHTTTTQTGNTFATTSKHILASTSTSQQTPTTQQVSEEAQTHTTTSTKPLTKTDILTRDLLQPYLAQKRAHTYSPKTAKLIVQNATQNLFALDYTPLTVNDIHITKQTDTTRAIQYKKELQKALQAIFDLNEYELTIYGRAIKNNSKQDFDTLAHRAHIYETAGENARAVTVPQDAVEAHLALVNGLKKFAVVLTILSKGYNDPAGSLSGTKHFNEAEDDIAHAFTQLKTYFILKNIATPSP